MWKIASDATIQTYIALDADTDMPGLQDVGFLSCGGGM